MTLSLENAASTPATNLGTFLKGVILTLLLIVSWIFPASAMSSGHRIPDILSQLEVCGRPDWNIHKIGSFDIFRCVPGVKKIAAAKRSPCR